MKALTKNTAARWLVAILVLGLTLGVLGTVSAVGDPFDGIRDITAEPGQEVYLGGVTATDEDGLPLVVIYTVAAAGEVENILLDNTTELLTVGAAGTVYTVTYIAYALGDVEQLSPVATDRCIITVAAPAEPAAEDEIILEDDSTSDETLIPDEALIPDEEPALSAAVLTFLNAVAAVDEQAALAAAQAYVAAQAAADATLDAAAAALAAATLPIAEAQTCYAYLLPEEQLLPAVSEAFAALQAIALSVEECLAASAALEPAEDIMLMDALGGTAPQLTGDWAYLDVFEIEDDPETTELDGLKDGSNPFDTDTDQTSLTYRERQGNDENDHNGKVRSFDTVTYKLHYVTKASGEYDFVKEGWLNYEMVLPYAATSAVFQTDSMAWVGTNMTDAAGLASLEEQTSGYYITIDPGQERQVLRGKYWLAPAEANPSVIPGEGTLTAVVQVKAMEQGDSLAPTFSAWMEHNTVGEPCPSHSRDEVVSFTAPPTEVTAEVRLDIELSGWAAEGMLTADFNSGDADAPNSDKGLVTGKAEAYMIGVYMWNGSNDKGRKGLMAPKSGDTLTFDLTLSSQVTPTDGTAISLNNTAYQPLLWALGSNDNMTDWRGRATLMNISEIWGMAANTAFGTHTQGDDACYNGGVWDYAIDGADSNKLHVTIEGLEIDLTNFPHWTMDHSYNYDTSGAIPIASGQMYLLQPVEIDGKHLMTDTSLTGSAIGSGKVDNSVTDGNMGYDYISKTDDNPYRLDNDDQTDKSNDYMGLKFYTEQGSGQYDSHVIWSNAPLYGQVGWIYNEASPMGDTTGGKYYLELGGDPVVRNQAIGAWFGFYHQNDIAGDNGTIVAGNSLLKFDSNAVTPTGSTVLQVAGCTMTALYATKQDGSAWASDDEMESTSMTALKYYASLSAIPAGHKCVGVLTEYRPVDASYTGIPLDRQHFYSDAGLTVTDDAVEGALYQCTIENYAWNKTAYEANGKNIPSLLNNSTLPAASWHWLPDDYNKGVVDPDTGHLAKDTGGFRWGDVLQVVCARSTITKEVAQIENNVNKVVYNLDSDQRFVDYKLNVSAQYITYNVVPPTGVTTTLTVVDELPTGLTFVANSAYYGGVYSQSSVPGRQGTVAGGTPLIPTIIPAGGVTLIKFEIPNITVGETIQPIYFTAEIGTRGVEATDVRDGDKITNYALSRIGAEISSQNAYVGLNAAGASIIIAKNGATSRSKLADHTYIELGDSFRWTLNVGNNGGTSMADVVAVDVLPYVGDGVSSFSGTPSLTKWQAAPAVGNLGDWQVYYTTSTAVRGSVSAEHPAAGIKAGSTSVNGTTITWTAMTLDATTGLAAIPTGQTPTAIAMVGDLPGSKTLKVNVEMRLNGGKQGDILANWLDGYPSPIYTVKRSLEGCVWNDTNKDGLRQDGESLLTGVTVTLLKLQAASAAFTPDPAKEADYQVVKDSSGNDVRVLTGKQIDAVTGVVTDHAAGRYQFNELPPGTYAVRFTSGSVALDNYAASPVNVGQDDGKDSDATATVSNNKLTQTLIVDLPLPMAGDSMNDPNQLSRNNDSGLYLDQFTLTVSKTVAQGDKGQEFTFVLELRDQTSGVYPYTGAAIPGVDKPQDGSLTLASTGAVSFKLKHGQSIIIAGLPANVLYDVRERDPGAGWTVTPATESISGTLDGPKTAAFTNSYAVQPVTFTLPVADKTLTGTLPDTFNVAFSASIAPVSTTASGLDAADMPMPALATVSTPAFTAAGSKAFAAFADIVYTVPGQYIYRVTEMNGGQAGVTYDKSEYLLTVEVADEDSRLQATSAITKVRDAAGLALTPAQSADSVTFNNTYAPAPATAKLSIIKTLVGNALPEAQAFTFTLSCDSNNVTWPTPATVVTTAIASGSSQPVSSGDITFKAAGTYAITVTETASGIPNMTDAAAQTVNIKVVDNAGQLTASFVDAAGDPIANGGQLTFVNTYDPTDAAITGVELDVTKTIGNHELPQAQAFTFDLARIDNSPAANVEMPTKVSATTTAISSGSAAPVSFGEITFKAAGEYIFRITEAASNIQGMTDASYQDITVQVTDNRQGALAAKIIRPAAGGHLTFTNSYSPAAALVTKAALNVTKTLDGPGHILPAAQSFTFTLARTDNNPAADVIMPTGAGLTATTAALASGSADPVGFGDITFKAAGTYSFTVTETVSDVHGLRYAAPQTVYIQVVDNDGTLTASFVDAAGEMAPTGGALTFTNTYTPRAAATEVAVEKEIAGDSPSTDEIFWFTLTAVSYTAPAGCSLTMTPAEMPLPAGSVDGVRTVRFKGAGKVSFDSYAYPTAGTYVYSIREIKGDHADYSYDKSVYTLTDIVTDNNGVLTYTRTIVKEGTDQPLEQITFVNTYARPYTSLTVTKQWAGDDNPQQPDSVLVQLYRDGKAYGETVTLTAKNNWKYTWSRLNEDYKWTVDEVSVPRGYTKLVSHTDTRWLITNTYAFMLNTEDHFAYIIGYPDGNVRPQDNITRAEVAAIFFRMLTDNMRETYWAAANSFSDVNADFWCNNGISTMARTGVVGGYPDGSFRPQDPITRAELVKIAVSFFKFTGNSGVAARFTDIQSHWAQNYISFAVELGLVDGYPDGTFAPDQYVTRAEAMKIINQVLKRAPERNHLLANMIVWPDNSDREKWYYAQVQEATNSHDYRWISYNGELMEQWTALLPVRDWAAFEKQWSTAYSAGNPGEVVNN